MAERECILIVDDEGSIRYLLSEELLHAGYQVLTAASGEEALVQLQREEIDLVVLDLQMSGIDGLQVMERIERQSLPPVVIMLTAYPSVDSAVGAMRRGGYDYLKKPCRTEELLASIERGLAKRRETLHRHRMARLIEETARQLHASAPAAEEVIPETATQARYLEGRGLLLDWEQEIVTCEGVDLSLTPTEFRLLACLMKRADQPVSFRELATALHGDDDAGWEDWEARQSLSTHLWRLRRKLGDAPGGSPYIVNVRGRGYKFVANA
jgi:DNA-binding response OmpR family regulator